MTTFNESAMQKILAQLESACPDFVGAVVATRDGLVLACVGEHQGDTPAACAASMSVHLRDDLQHLGSFGDVSLREALLFGHRALWYLHQFNSGHVLLVQSGPSTHVGGVRLAGQTIAARLRRLLD